MFSRWQRQNGVHRKAGIRLTVEGVDSARDEPRAPHRQGKH